jgi:ribonuclease BN (tRNA processing enzyme)
MRRVGRWLFLLLGLPNPLYSQAGTRVVILGTGTPNPDPERSGPAVAVIVKGTAYLVDAGAGVMRRAAQATANGIAALDSPKLGIVFLTHLHSDHTIGLPDVIHTGWILGREHPLRLLGPPGTVDMARHLTEAYSADVANRTGGMQPHTADGWRVDARDIDAGMVYQDSNVTVTAFRVAHDGWAEALGYRFQTADRSIVISGDTRPSDAVVEACAGCDILLHEVYSTEKLATRTPAWQRYHADAHTSTDQLAALATRAHPKLLVLYHQLFWGASDDDLIREIRRGYSGEVVSARDLAVYPALP